MRTDDTISIDSSGSQEYEPDNEDKPLDYHRRKSDKLAHRPVTLGHILTLFTIVFTPLIGMILWNNQLANEAKVDAATSRPYPYTALDHAEYAARHEREHNEQEEESRRDVRSLLMITEQKLSRQIESLERPPKETVKLLSAMRDRLIRLETIIEQYIEAQGKK